MRAEFAAVPAAVLVHEPVRAGAFQAMERATDPGVLERDFLYRALPDAELYAAQHARLVAELRRHVERVLYLEELAGGDGFRSLTRANPNHVFTRDSLITIPWVPGGYIGARMRPPLRRQERTLMERAVQRLGLQEILSLPEHLFLEGGDVIPFAAGDRRILLAGHGRRTSREALSFLRETLIPEFADEIIAIELAEWRMNLDGGLVPVADDVVVSDTRSIVGAELFDRRGCRALDVLSFFRDLGMHIIDTTQWESVYAQSCNCLCLGHRTVIYYDLCPRVRRLLEEHAVTVRCIPGSELVKGRGGPRCMTRPIYAREAAPHRRA